MTSTVVYDENLRTVCTHIRSGIEIETDAPPDNNGNGDRFSPTDLVATALASCMLTTMGIKARGMDVNLKGIQIEVEKIMASDPRRISAINLTFHFPDGFKVSPKDQTILERTALTCPVFYSIHPDIKVKVDFNLRKDSAGE